MLYSFILYDKPKCVIIQMEAIEQWVYVALLVVLYNVVLTFESVDETRLVYDHSMKAMYCLLCGWMKN